MVASAEQKRTRVRWLLVGIGVLAIGANAWIFSRAAQNDRSRWRDLCISLINEKAPTTTLHGLIGTAGRSLTPFNADISGSYLYYFSIDDRVAVADLSLVPTDDFPLDYQANFHAILIDETLNRVMWNADGPIGSSVDYRPDAHGKSCWNISSLGYVHWNAAPSASELVGEGSKRDASLVVGRRYILWVEVREPRTESSAVGFRLTPEFRDINYK